MSKTILKFALCLSAVVAFFSLGGCGDKPFEWNFPLTVAQRALTLSSDAGVIHVLVYSTGDWTACFDREIDWASLDRRSGSGNGEFVFSYNANYGISRQITVRLASGNLRDSVVISQTGAQSSATVTFAESAITVADTAATISVGFSTNLLFSWNDFIAEVTYYDESGNASDPVRVKTRAEDDEDVEEGDETNDDGVEDSPVTVTSWISNVVVSSDAVTFDVARNKQDLYRIADLRVYVEDNLGSQYGSTLTVTQIPAGFAY